MKSPLHPRIQTVFIQVSNVVESLRWYADLFGVSPGPVSHGSLIGDITLAGETGIILDGHAHHRGHPVDRESVRFMIRTQDLAEAHRFAQQHGHNVSEIEDIGSANVFYLEDPDGNRLCVIYFKY